MQILISPWELRLLLELQTQSTHQTASRRRTHPATVWRAYRVLVRRLLQARPYVRIELLQRRPHATRFSDLSAGDHHELLNRGVEFSALTNAAPARIRRGRRRAYERSNPHRRPRPSNA